MAFRDTLADFQMLQGDVVSGRFASIYLLQGEETYFIDKLEEVITQGVLPPEERDFNMTVVYGKDSVADQIALACRRYPMMAERQLVVVREAQSLSRIADLEAYAKQPTASTVLVLCHKGKNLDKRSALYKAIAKNGVVFDSSSPRDYELEGFVKSFLAGKKVKAEGKAIAMLCEFIGANLSKLDNEIDKLLSILPVENPLLTPEVIEKNIGVSKDYNVFELTRALSARNFGQAMKICEHFASNPKNYPLVLTMGTLFTHFQRIVIVGLMQWEAKRKKTAPPSDADMAKRMGVTPYFVKEYIGAAKAYPLKNAFEVLGLLREYDMKSKGIGGGTTDDGELLKELLLRIAVA